MVNKKPSDKLFEDNVLCEALMDLLDYGVKINPFNQPIIETWIKLWREDFRFKNYIIDRQKKLKPGRCLLIELLKDKPEAKNGFHIVIRKKKKKVHYKII